MDLYELLLNDNLTDIQFKSLLCNQSTINRLKNMTELMHLIYRECANKTAESSNIYPIVTNGNTPTNDEVDSTVFISTSVTLFVLGVILNLLLFKVSCNKQRDGRKLTYIQNIVVADILVLLSMLAFVIYYFFQPSNWSTKIHQYLFPSIDMFVSSTSMLSALIIALRRVLCVCRSKLWLKSYVDCHQSNVVALIWAYGLILFILSFSRVFVEYTETFKKVFVLFAVIVSLCGCMITLFCHLTVLYAYNSLKSRQTIHCTVQQYYIKVESKNRRKCLMNSLMTLTALSPFVAGWTFYLGIHAYELIGNTYIDSERLNLAMLVIPWIVSATNPVALIALNKSLRKELKKIICSYKRCNQSGSAEEDVLTCTV